MYRNTAEDAFVERRYNLVAVFKGGANQSAQCSAIFLVDNHVVRHVNQTAGEVSGIGRFHGRVGKTLTRTVRRNEVFQHRHTLFEVREDGVFDNLLSFGTCLLRLSHQSTHTRELLNLVFRTTGTRVEHHEHGVKALVGLGHLFHQHITQVVVYVCPRVDYLVIAFGIGNETHVVVLGNLAYFLVTAFNNLFFLFRNDDVVEVERQSGNVCHAVTQVLDAIEKFASASHTHTLNNVGDDATQGFLRDNFVEIAHLVGDDAVYDNASYGGFNHAGLQFTVNEVGYNYLNGRVQVAAAFVVGDDCLFGSVESKSRTLCTWAYLGDVI